MPEVLGLGVAVRQVPQAPVEMNDVPFFLAKPLVEFLEAVPGVPRVVASTYRSIAALCVCFTIALRSAPGTCAGLGRHYTWVPWPPPVGERPRAPSVRCTRPGGCATEWVGTSTGSSRSRRMRSRIGRNNFLPGQRQGRGQERLPQPSSEGRTRGGGTQEGGGGVFCMSVLCILSDSPLGSSAKSPGKVRGPLDGENPRARRQGKSAGLDEHPDPPSGHTPRAPRRLARISTIH